MNEKELVKNLKCDELCALNSMKKEGKGKIKKQIEKQECDCY